MVKDDTQQKLQKNFRLTPSCLALLDRISEVRHDARTCHTVERLVREDAARMYLAGRLAGPLDL